MKELPSEVKDGVNFYYADSYDDVAKILFNEVKDRIDKIENKYKPELIDLKAEDLPLKNQEEKPQSEVAVS